MEIRGFFMDDGGNPAFQWPAEVPPRESTMNMDELDYDLPPEAIAVRPAEPRDSSRLMVVRRGGGAAEHRRFYQIGEFLRAGDLLVVNETRVLKAKVLLRRESGAAIGGLFVRERGPGLWEMMLRTRGRAKKGETLLAGGYRFLLQEHIGEIREGMWLVRVSPGKNPAEVLGDIGAVPLPPYIERRRSALLAHPSDHPPENAGDAAWYQTVYARPQGKSVAAPTAGLHFTADLLMRLAAQGISRAGVELDVGPGTFLPVETRTLEEHPMHREHYRVPAETIAAIRNTRTAGGQIVAVGTTAVRTLESCAGQILAPSAPAEISGETALKIGPGFSFRATDILLTNFHLPRSTLMALVAAFLGENGAERLKALYAEAVREGYRFYSYGDAMLILP